MVLTSRQPTADLLHHSNRGSPYTSAQYQQMLATWHIQMSMRELDEDLTHFGQTLVIATEPTPEHKEGKTALNDPV